MTRSRTLKTAQATSSTDEKSRTVNINLTAPTSWRELSQEQLLTVFDLMAIEQEPTAVKTYMLIYFCGLHVIKHTRFGWKFWTMVDGREKNGLYEVYEDVMAEMELSVLSTRLPDSKKYRRDLSEERKGVFRSTIFPMDSALLKGSGIKEFAEEISNIINNP